MEPSRSITLVAISRYLGDYMPNIDLALLEIVYNKPPPVHSTSCQGWYYEESTNPVSSRSETRYCLSAHSTYTDALALLGHLSHFSPMIKQLFLHLTGYSRHYLISLTPPTVWLHTIQMSQKLYFVSTVVFARCNYFPGIPVE
jgi:hypothetical protein